MAQVRGTVRRADGTPIASATIADVDGHRLATSSADGTFTLDKPPAQIEVSAPHYVTAVVTIAQGEALNVVLRQPLETVTVTAYRSALGSSDSPVSTRVLDQQQLQQAAVPALDGKLREVPGFELFRRSSSLVANPTTEGRLACAASAPRLPAARLCVLDDIPLNDPFGGWIHWEELPELAIHSVEVVRGGASRICTDPAPSAASSASFRCGLQHTGLRDRHQRRFGEHARRRRVADAEARRRGPALPAVD